MVFLLFHSLGMDAKYIDQCCIAVLKTNCFDSHIKQSHQIGVGIDSPLSTSQSGEASRMSELSVSTGSKDLGSKELGGQYAAPATPVKISF